MTRDSAFWITIATSTLIPGCFVGVLKGQHRTRTYLALTKELQQHGCDLSASECQTLLKLLQRSPQSIVTSENRSEIREIKQRHIAGYLPHARKLRRLYWIVIGIAVVSFFAFQAFWPKDSLK